MSIFTRPSGKPSAHIWENSIAPDQFTGKGTQTGALKSPTGEIPATGRSITLNLCDVHEIRDGKIRSVQSYFDSASMLMQLGVMPEAAVGAKA